MDFIKSKELQLINGGYLANKEEKPVYHAEFVEAQDKAHYLVKLAEAIKGKDFAGKKADSFTAIVDEVSKKINDTQAIEYAKAGKEPKMKLRDDLKKEAMAFLEFESSKDLTKKINEDMQAFNIIQEFEEFGLYFEEEIIKLPAIYTIAEILKAVTAITEQLNKKD